jgi:hypothetical protein
MTRDAARAAGSRLYFTGEECPRGHIAPRYTVNRQCKICTYENQAVRKAKDPEKFSASCRASVAKWRLNNPEKSQQWAKDNREKVLAAGRRWCKRNPHKLLEKARLYRAKNRAPSRKAALAWQNKFPEKKWAINRERAAAKSKATPPWLTDNQRLEMVEMYKAARRLSRDTGIEHHVDHIHPIKGKKSCGLHVPWNLQILRASENISKGNKLTRIDVGHHPLLDPSFIAEPAHDHDCRPRGDCRI